MVRLLGYSKSIGCMEPTFLGLAFLVKDARLSVPEEINRIMKRFLDTIQQEIKSRLTRLSDPNSKFEFLLDIEKLFNTTLENDVKISCKNLSRFYNTDSDGSGLHAEIDAANKVPRIQLYQVSTDCLHNLIVTAREDCLSSNEILGRPTYMSAYATTRRPRLQVPLEDPDAYIL
ncbi:unnamed protein product [Larinioides sclopetarius]|uniref:Uncharacterized protein n=1 Tax=Larinioides sclopetarius TaxID=280406 RepID=A0AAV2AA58_9ARAC